jgi:hypothetical protein
MALSGRVFDACLLGEHSPYFGTLADSPFSINQSHGFEGSALTDLSVF